MIEFAYKRLNDTQCTVAFVKTQDDAIGWIEWMDRTIEDDEDGVLSLWAIIALYELARGNELLEAIEFIRTKNAPLDVHRFAPTTHSSPSVTEQIPALIDASKALLRHCVTLESNHAQCLLVTCRHRQLLDLFIDPQPVEVGYSGVLLEWVDTSFVPHKAPYDPTELHCLPDLCRPLQSLSPFEGDTHEDNTPEEQVFFTNDGSSLITMNQAGDVVAFDTTNFEVKWRCCTGTLFPCGRIEPQNQILIIKAFDLDLYEFTINVEDGTILNEKDHLGPEYETVSSTGNWSAVLSGYPHTSVTITGPGAMNAFKIQQPGAIECVVFSPDETKLLLGGMYDTFAFIDLNAQQITRQYDVESDRVLDLSFSADGRHFSMKTYRFIKNKNMSVITIQRVECGTVVNRFCEHGYVNAPRWSPCGKWVAMTDERNIRVFPTGVLAV